MIELEKNDFYIVQPLLQCKEGYLIPESVIEHNNPGWVFVDSQINPQAALIWPHGIEGFYLAGKNITQYEKELNSFIDSYIRPKLLSIGITYIEICGIPPVTDMEIQNILGFRNLDSWQQSKYSYMKKSIHSFTANAHLHNVKDIFEKEHSFKNIDLLKKTILSYWDSIGTFLNKADGFCMVIDDIVISWAITAWIAGNNHEPRIDTIENYRQKGFAKSCSSAILKCYLEKGYIPYWECEKDNTASAKTAEGLGFSKLFDYNCYGFSIDE
jgi:hypothetical protein